MARNFFKNKIDWEKTVRKNTVCTWAVSDFLPKFLAHTKNRVLSVGIFTQIWQFYPDFWRTQKTEYFFIGIFTPILQFYPNFWRTQKTEYSRLEFLHKFWKFYPNFWRTQKTEYSRLEFLHKFYNFTQISGVHRKLSTPDGNFFPETQESNLIVHFIQ